ncbi:uncharacterized protein LOC125072106 [Vanessa atalanta]|uniref:uncharacterized protein LOC125072106 n=1 Tax=Vanessa atalanta TaxID=42275 RepID=UPI001FCD337B|nr:uncharacterized protein LOC125072106 [Vanessa atalanta]
MDYKIILCFILLMYIVAADDDNDDYNNYEDEYENTLSDEEFTKKDESVTTRPVSRYEVTEIVIDIPDNRTKGPIVTNYSIARPLNLAPTNITLTIFEKENNTVDNNNNNKITANKNDKDDKITDPYDNLPFMPMIKEYFLGIKKGIVDGFNSIVHVNEKSNDVDHVRSYEGPLSFLSKLHKQSSDSAHKFHSTLFGPKFDDIL